MVPVWPKSPEPLARSQRDPHAPCRQGGPALPMVRVLRQGCAQERNTGPGGEWSRIPGFVLVSVLGSDAAGGPSQEGACYQIYN